MKRLERRSTVRQALFTSDYLKSKYPHIFKEVATMYNQLNTDYPKKPDLRKCQEYRWWKNSMAVQHGKETVPIRTRKPYRYCMASYNNIVVNPDSLATPEKQQQKTMQLNIELIPFPPGNKHQETVVEQSGPPSAPEESNPPSTSEEQPLPEPLPEPTEDIIDPYRPDDEIPPAILEKIMSELRLDPQLSAIMNDVETGMQDQEQSLEVDIPELEVDIPELDQIFDQDDIFW